ncbi:MAG: hypothetical protein RL385_4526 [Pseudomonadota bacterium]
MSPLRMLMLALALLGVHTRAEAQLLGRLDPRGLSALGSIPSMAAPQSVARELGEISRADAWILGMHEARGRRERAERWAVPLMYGLGAAVAVAGIFEAKDTGAKAILGTSAAMAGLSAGFSFLLEPEQRGPFFVLGGSVFAATFSAGTIVDAYKHTGCDGYCFNERAFGWLGGALAAEALTFLPLAFIDRGPTKADLEHYVRLPIEERPHAARMLLSRIDRAERKALAVSLGMQLAALAVLTTGAAVVRDDGAQVPLFALSGVGFGMTSFMTLVSLLKPTRLERFIAGERPGSVERVFW